VQLVPFERLQPADALVAAVAHEQYRRLGAPELKRLLKKPPLVMDVKAMFSRAALEAAGIRVWRL
ncbi:MAG TPA: nucleotide sugar dehydrogenase, partial [Gammaproteobacteria bacterium]|nr:nucleotide sugar dehydrogenase [Gammaproteobacteria bacterium]